MQLIRYYAALYFSQDDVRVTWIDALAKRWGKNGSNEAGSVDLQGIKPATTDGPDSTFNSIHAISDRFTSMQSNVAANE